MLALLLFVGSLAAGSLGAGSWRHGVQAQARHEFTRQADGVTTKVQQHFDNLDAVFTAADAAVRSGHPLKQALDAKDVIRNYPGVLEVGHVVRAANGTVTVPEEYATVASFGLVDFRLSTMVGPQLQNVLTDSARQKRRTASSRYEIRWSAASKEPSFFLATPSGTPSVDGRSGDWIVVLVYGNWLVQDAIQEAGSTFRAELVEGDQQIAGDYLPIGTNAGRPPAAIPADAERTVTPMTRYGRPWTLVVADAEGVTRPHIGSQPSWLMVGVSLLGLLSALLVWVLGRSRGKALVMVERATAELRESQEQLRHLAFHDSLTGLANRALLDDRLEEAIARDDEEHDGVALMLCDLDGFKAVNDQLGHAEGDEVLAEVGRRLLSCVRPEDTAARVGGDEFALLLPGPIDVAEARAVGERLLAALRIPVALPDGDVILVTGSIGIAMRLPGVGASDLVRQADAAMYAAKAEGKSRTLLHEPVPA